MKIELWADVACPWCYIGERRLRRAIQASEVEAQVRWRPFQLQPGIPPEGIPWAEFVSARFGGWGRARAGFAQVARAGEEDGLQFDFERVASFPNTTDAHRLLLLAEARGRLWEAADVVYPAYFAEGRDVGDREVLMELGGLAGLDPDELREVLASDAYRAEIRDSQLQARELGIAGVPFVVLANAFAVSGAQPLEVFRAAISRAAGEAAV
jgi:predicted DsbA family dithiol-disulfide isomerase